jgi:hypothetical protein
MTRRKGEITRARLQREWPHHVVLSTDKVRGLDKSAMVRGFADTLSVAPLTYQCAAITASSWCSALPSRRTQRRSALDLVGSRRRGGNDGRYPTAQARLPRQRKLAIRMICHPVFRGGKRNGAVDAICFHGKGRLRVKLIGQHPLDQLSSLPAALRLGTQRRHFHTAFFPIEMKPRLAIF